LIALGGDRSSDEYAPAARPVQAHLETRTMSDGTVIRRLHRLIGRDCRWLGRSCRIVDVLPQEARLVLELHEEMPPVQLDQYGQAAYRANEILELPLFDADGGFSEDLMLLLDGLTDEPRTTAGSRAAAA
jgi:hypothetical protein